MKYIKLFEAWVNEAEEAPGVNLKTLTIGEYFKLPVKNRKDVVESIFSALAKKGVINKNQIDVRDEDDTIYLNIDGVDKIDFVELKPKDLSSQDPNKNVFEILFGLGSVAGVPESAVPLFLYLNKLRSDADAKDAKGPLKLYLDNFKSGSPGVKDVTSPDYTFKKNKELADKFIGSSGDSIASSAQKDLEMAIKSSKEKEA